MNTGLDIRMLGGLSIRLGGGELSDESSRSKKVWLMLSYLICSRGRAVMQKELVNLLWGDEGGSGNPVNALKTMVHRARSALDELGGGMGHMLITRRGGGYAWNCEIPGVLDTESFEALCAAGAACGGEDEKLSKYMAAVSVYGGDFLPKLSSEAWVVAQSVRLHELFVRTANAAAELLQSAGRMAESAELCRRAIKIEPCDEELYIHFMRALIAEDRGGEAVTVYLDMCRLMYENFGVAPSEEIKALYREARNTVSDSKISLVTLQEQLREPGGAFGALICDYDLFKVIYQAQTRGVERSGSAVHIGMLSVADAAGGELSRQSLETCMGNLRKIIYSSLRKGDVASRCSLSQYILLLPQANYENACMVCERVTRSFSRQYPHSPARLSYAVRPVGPDR